MSFRPSAKFLKRSVFLLAATGFCVGVPMHAERTLGEAFSLQAMNDRPWPVPTHGPTTGVDVLSDTQGVDFGPYIGKMLYTVNDAWRKRLAQDAVVPTDTLKTTLIRIAIKPDGIVASMHLDSTSHDAALDRAAWDSMTQIKSFSPLPAKFTGPVFEFRFHFNVAAASVPNVP